MDLYGRENEMKTIRDTVDGSDFNFVRHSIWESVWTSVSESVHESVWTSVWKSDWNSILDSVYESVRRFTEEKLK